MSDSTSYPVSATVSEEQKLLHLAAQLNTRALAEIYDAYSSGIYRYAMRRLGDGAVAEDCVAETFARFLKALQERRGPREHLQAYLYRIAHNWIVDFYRNNEQTYELSEALRSEADIPEDEAAKAHPAEAGPQGDPDAYARPAERCCAQVSGGLVQ